MGDDGFPFSLRKLSAGQPLRADVEGRLWRRVQDLQQTLHSLQMEDGQNIAPETNEHLPYLRSSEELLPGMHA